MTQPRVVLDVQVRIDVLVLDPINETADDPFTLQRASVLSQCRGWWSCLTRGWLLTSEPVRYSSGLTLVHTPHARLIWFAGHRSVRQSSNLTPFELRLYYALIKSLYLCVNPNQSVERTYPAIYIASKINSDQWIHNGADMPPLFHQRSSSNFATHAGAV
jgi:hypothetical protein